MFCGVCMLHISVYVVRTYVCVVCFIFSLMLVFTLGQIPDFPRVVTHISGNTEGPSLATLQLKGVTKATCTSRYHTSNVGSCQHW